MAGTSAIGEALRRIEAAVGEIETAVETRMEDARTAAGMEGEMHRLVADRSRLAQSLDAAEAKSARVEEANRDVSRRLVAAMETIRDVLEKNNAA